MQFEQLCKQSVFRSEKILKIYAALEATSSVSIAMSSLKTVLAQLSSDKIKERHEGITALRDALVQDRAVRRLDEEGNGQTWLVIFQALFKVVVTEKVLYNKKPGDAPERRLREAASAVRWLTERLVDRLNKKVRMVSVKVRKV